MRPNDRYRRGFSRVLVSAPIFFFLLTAFVMRNDFSRYAAEILKPRAPVAHTFLEDVGWAVLAIALVWGALLLWSLSLRRQVAARTKALELEIQERKQAEQALREKEEQYRAVAESSSDYIMRYDKNFRHVFANQAAIAVTGLPVEQYIGKTHREMGFSEDLCELWERYLQQVFDTGKSVTVEFDVEMAQGRMYLSLVFNPEFSPDGSVNSVIGISRDVTERKQAEEALYESKERLRLAVLAGRMGTWDRDFVSGKLEWSIECKTMFGLAPETEMNDERFVQALHPDDREATDLAIREALEKQIDFNMEYRVVWPDGALHWIAAQGHGYYNDAGQPIRMVGITFDITERKQADEALQKSEQRYRSLFDNMTEGFALHKLIFDENGEPCDYLFLDVNRAFEEITGLKRENIVGKGQREVLSEEDPFWLKTYAKVALTGESIRLEHYSPALQKHYEVNAYCPAPNQFAVIFKDITARKQAELDLLEKEVQYRNLADAGSALIWKSGTDRLCNYFNEPWLKFTGRTLQQEMGNGWAEGVHPDDFERCLQTYVIAFDKRESFDMEYRLRHVSGEYRWLQDLGTPNYNSSGEFVGYIGHCFDISERKRVEDALKESEERWRRAITDSPIPIMIHDEDDQVLQLSSGWTRYSGYALEDIPTLADWTERAYGERTGNKKEYIDNLFSIDKTVNNGEWTVTAKNGSKRIWAFQTTPLGRMNKNKRVLHSMALDITERKRAEAEVDQINASLEQRIKDRTQELLDAQEQLVRNEKLAALGQMAGSVGHELRNPLGVISNATYFLKMAQPDANETVKEYLNLIEKHVQISSKIIADLLDFTRIKAIERARVSIPELIRQTLERFPIPDSVQVEIDAPADLPQAYADAHHVIQILGNLVLNACQAMKDGGQLSIISRQSSVSGQQLLITVKDTGAGISPENMKKIFEPLFTTKPKGIGLGLAVSRKLAEANGGSLEVQSEAGIGSAFTLCLPLDRSAS